MAELKAPSAGTKNVVHERRLVTAAQQDPARFAELYELNFSRVYGYLARRLQDRAATEDLTSEVFHRALRALPSFDWRGIPFSVWLLRIAANLLADRWRSMARETPIHRADDLAMSYTPEFDQHEEIGRLERAVDKLPDEQKRVIYSRFTLGKSAREIAQDLHRTEGAVKQLQFRAIKRLRAGLEGSRG